MHSKDDIDLQRSYKPAIEEEKAAGGDAVHDFHLVRDDATSEV